MVETVILQTICTNELKTEDIPIAANLDHPIQIMTNEAFIRGSPRSSNWFIYMNTPIMSFIPPTLLLATQKHHNMQEAQFIRTIYCHPL